MSPLVDRLYQISLHVAHLREIRPRVIGPKALSDDLTLQNDVLHSLQIVCQAVIDIASELSSRRMLRFGAYSEAVQNLAAFPEFSATLVQDLSKLPGFRNILVHEYVALDYSRIIDALNNLDSVEEFVRIVARMEAESGG